MFLEPVPTYPIALLSTPGPDFLGDTLSLVVGFHLPTEPAASYSSQVSIPLAPLPRPQTHPKPETLAQATSIHLLKIFAKQPSAKILPENFHCFSFLLPLLHPKPYVSLFCTLIKCSNAGRSFILSVERNIHTSSSVIPVGHPVFAPFCARPWEGIYLTAACLWKQQSHYK